MSTRRNFMKAAGLALAATSRDASGDDATAQDTSVKRIYIAADDHTDYMWTADEKTYRKAFLKTIDHYLDLADQTDDRDVSLQSRWNCDGLLWFYEYEQNKTQAEIDRLVTRIKSGHISVPMTMLVSCYGGMPTEAAIRGLYYGGHVERKYGIELPIATAMENQTLPYGLGMLWAGSGVKYSWRGICGCASKLKHSGGNRQHDVYWWVGKDGSRVLMKWYSLAQSLRRGLGWNEGPGGYAEARHPELAINFVDRDARFKAKNPQEVIGLFGQGWDDLDTVVPLGDIKNSFPSVAARMTNETRRVIVSNELDYFEDFEKHYGDDLPEVACSFGNEWELYNASLAEVSASVKRATGKLRAAEAMAAIVAMDQPGFAVDLQEEKQQAWIAFGLYWEHDWTADGPVSKNKREAWQRRIAKQITDYVDSLHELASKELAESIAAKVSQRPGEVRSGTPQSFVVFNPLGWQRDAVAEVEFDGEFVDIVDIQNDQAVPSQINVRGNETVLQFVAKDLPPLGYRVYEVRRRKSSPSDGPTIAFDQGRFKSKFHTLSINPNGSISQWRSEETGTMIIADGKLGNELEAAKGTTQVESSGAVSTTVRVDVVRPIKRQTRITLYESHERIDIDNRIQESFGEVEKWKFEFNLDGAQTIHEEVGAIIRAATLSGGGDYADENARTDWLTLNHFVKLHDDDTAVMIANRDCLFFHLGEDTSESMDAASGTIHVLAGGQVDGKKLGIQNQGGDRNFLQRFSLTAAEELSQTQAMKTAMEFANPAVVIPAKASVSASKSQFIPLVSIDSDDVIIWAVKPVEEETVEEETVESNAKVGEQAGQGRAGEMIVRLWNLADRSSEYSLTLAARFKRCVQTTHVETELDEIEMQGGKVEGSLASGAMLTLRFESLSDSVGGEALGSQ